MKDEPGKVESALQPQTTPATIEPETPAKPVKISYPQRSTAVYQVFEYELDSLTSLGNSLDLTLAGIFFGAALTLGVTLGTASFTSPYTHASFVAAFLVSIGFTLFFGIRAGIEVNRSRKYIKRIKTESPTVPSN